LDVFTLYTQKSLFVQFGEYMEISFSLFENPSLKHPLRFELKKSESKHKVNVFFIICLD